ncbi:hypothetical protein GW17_00058629 [Ensete ventricosum]|nr:hypothetical protein GW17_00058629 [Ensete ventricosum]
MLTHGHNIKHINIFGARRADVARAPATDQPWGAPRGRDSRRAPGPRPPRTSLSPSLSGWERSIPDPEQILDIVQRPEALSSRGWYGATRRLARGIPQPHATSPNLNQNDSIYHSSHSPSEPPIPARLADHAIADTVTSAPTKSLIGAPYVPTDPSSSTIRSVGA